jgi:hypothetical protein
MVLHSLPLRLLLLRGPQEPPALDGADERLPDELASAQLPDELV